MSTVPHSRLTRQPALSFTTLVAEDAADQADYISLWQQEYAQLSAGNFHGRIDELRSGPLQIFREFSHQETWQTCQPWNGSIWFGIPARDSGDNLRFNGQSVPSCSILLSAGGQEFTLRTPENFCIYGIVIDKNYLHLRYQALFDAELPPHWKIASAIGMESERHHMLCRAVEELLQHAREHPDTLKRSQYIDIVIDQLLIGIQLSGSAATPDRENSMMRHALRVQQARLLALDNHSQHHTVEALCQNLHITRRTLQNSFQEVMGMSPLHFIRSLRLNAVRQALRSEERVEESIQDLAAEWGFLNLSHFSYDYKRLFGETPSQTRLYWLGLDTVRLG